MVIIDWGYMGLLEQFIDNGFPVIANVNTSDLPYWNQAANHALLVTGYDATRIYVNDPALDRGQVPIVRHRFELSWLENDYVFGVLQSK